MLLRKSC